MSYIIIGFSTHDTALSNIIKGIQKTEYSHCYVKWYSDKLDRTLIYQASGTKVNFVGSESFHKNNRIISEYIIRVTDEQKTKLIQRAIDLAGTPYGTLPLIGMLWVELARKFDKKVKNPLSDRSKTYFCAELVADLLAEIGIIDTNKETMDSLDVRDLEELIKGKYENGQF